MLQLGRDIQRRSGAVAWRREWDAAIAARRNDIRGAGGFSIVTAVARIRESRPRGRPRAIEACRAASSGPADPHRRRARGPRRAARRGTRRSAHPAFPRTKRRNSMRSSSDGASRWHNKQARDGERANEAGRAAKRTSSGTWRDSRGCAASRIDSCSRTDFTVTTAVGEDREFLARRRTWSPRCGCRRLVAVATDRGQQAT